MVKGHVVQGWTMTHNIMLFLPTRMIALVLFPPMKSINLDSGISKLIDRVLKTRPTLILVYQWNRSILFHQRNRSGSCCVCQQNRLVRRDFHEWNRSTDLIRTSNYEKHAPVSHLLHECFYITSLIYVCSEFRCWWVFTKRTRHD